MATNFPTSLDALSNPISTDSLNNPSHSDQHANANDAIEALEAKVGVNSSAVSTSLDFLVTQANARNSGGLTSGTYYTTSSNTLTTGTAAGSTGTVSFIPFLVEQTTTFDRIACRTGGTVTGTSTVRLGIYNNSNRKPTTVLLDAGTVAATATVTIYSITINQTLNPGWYWLAHVVNSTTGTNTFYQVTDGVPFNQSPISSATFAFQPYYVQTGVTGAFATASPSATATTRVLTALRVA
jgi:hypothetical protein